MQKILLVALTLLTLSACSIESGSGGDKGSNPNNPNTKPQGNRVDWKSISSDFNPSIDEHELQHNDVEKIQMNLFGSGSDVNVMYSKQLQPGTIVVRLYKVWKRQVSWGNFVTNLSGTTLNLNNYGQYQCSIRITNRRIAELDGGCYVRTEVVLPMGSEIEVYDRSTLVSKRFIPMSVSEFLNRIDDASFSDGKFTVIEEYLASFKNSKKNPMLLADQLGVVVGEFIRGEEKLKALRRLHIYVTDRENLERMIEDEFSYFERKDARAIVGLR